MNLRSRLESLRPALAAAAQAVVDEWDQGDDGVDEMFGEGGACDAVAQAMAGVLGSIDTIEGGQPGDDHAYLIAFDDTDAFAVDIPPGVYETGGGYRWRKRQGAQISEDDVVIDPVNRSDIEAEMEENATEQVPNASHSVHPTVVQYAVQEMFKGKSPAIAARNTAQRLSGGTNMFIDSTREIEIDPVELEEALWKNMADYTMKYPPKPGDERNVARGTLSYFNQWKWGKPPKTKLEDRLMEYMAQRGTVEHMPNHSAVHYVWLIDYRGVPMDTEGPYGPMSLDRAAAFARIGAKEGDHDRAVSIGTDIMSDGFEILRRYRRGTGERVL